MQELLWALVGFLCGLVPPLWGWLRRYYALVKELSELQAALVVILDDILAILEKVVTESQEGESQREV